MIKTIHKEHPPEGESYVLNATEISELLHGIPQYDQLTISFNFNNSLYYRNAKKGVHTNDVPILYVYYKRRGGVFFSRNKLRSGELPSVSWSLYQKAISSNLRQSLKRIICNEIREDIRELFLDSRGFERCQGRLIEIAFNFHKETVLLKDIQDGNVQLVKETSITER